MILSDANGLPLSATVASASPHESKLVEQCLDERFVPEAPQRLIGDRAYDCDALDERLAAEHAVELVSPHRHGRKRPATQDQRVLRRYKRRWKIERLIAWLGNRRRILIRYERHLVNFHGFVLLACVLILANAILG
jgi:transposase